MTDIVHIYCDESCHLEHDHHETMVLGAVTHPADTRKRLGRQIKQLKAQHGIPADREIKWSQVSPSRLDFYIGLVDLIFDDPDTRFRCVVVPSKRSLDHARFNQTHDDFYYKMWWQVLTYLIDGEHRFRFFVDIKDTHSARKLSKLHEVLCNTHYDFDARRILSVDAVRSDDVPLLQVADLLIGAVSYAHRDHADSPAKLKLIQHVRARSGLTLLKSTPLGARKLNVFVWHGREQA